MTQLRYLISEADAQAMWREKDQARSNTLLRQDPMLMHKAKFLRWLEARAAADLEQARERGQDEIEALGEISDRLRTVTRRWKQEAKRINEGR